MSETNLKPKTKTLMKFCKEEIANCKSSAECDLPYTGDRIKREFVGVYDSLTTLLNGIENLDDDHNQTNKWITDLLYRVAKLEDIAEQLSKRLDGLEKKIK